MFTLIITVMFKVHIKFSGRNGVGIQRRGSIQVPDLAAGEITTQNLAPEHLLSKCGCNLRVSDRSGRDPSARTLPYMTIAADCKTIAGLFML